MSSKEIIKLLRRGLFSNALLQMAADKIDELENKLAFQHLMDATQPRKGVRGDGLY